MESVLVNMTKAETKRQLNFLIRKEFSLIYSGFRKPFYYLLALTIVVLAFTFLTSTEILDTLKVVSIVLVTLGWLLLIILLVIMGYKLFQRIRWRNMSIKKAFEGDTS